MSYTKCMCFFFLSCISCFQIIIFCKISKRDKMCQSNSRKYVKCCQCLSKVLQIVIKFGWSKWWRTDCQCLTNVEPGAEKKLLNLVDLEKYGKESISIYWKDLIRYGRERPVQILSSAYLLVPGFRNAKNRRTRRARARARRVVRCPLKKKRSRKRGRTGSPSFSAGSHLSRK